ncbi:hypothetical protein [Halobellus limi]|nr:hypothetical protein [Halobellus limi]
MVRATAADEVAGTAERAAERGRGAATSNRTRLTRCSPLYEYRYHVPREW